MDSLWRKGFYIPNICLLCYSESELLSHLFLHCPFSWEIWCCLARDFGVTFIAHLTIRGLMGGWSNPMLSCFGKWIWRLVPLVVCWAIWLERNNWVFKGHSKSAWEVYWRAKDFILFWVYRCKGYDGLPEGALVRNWANAFELHDP